MRVEDFVEVLGCDFYTGVPDSLLKPLSSYLMDNYGLDPRHHIIGANEGNCVGLAAGYHLASGKTPLVYMQNSGEGNIVNPVASLCNELVYGVPCVLVVGWRGEPGVHDEPQHLFQGEITLKLLDTLNIEYLVIERDTTVDDLAKRMVEFRELLALGRQVALVVRKGALEYSGRVKYSNNYSLNREEAIKHIIKFSKDDPIVSTTGKISRELFESRECHQYDFLTVGSMGHSSSVALGVALNSDRRVWCLDGDGAMIMHMGALATIGSVCPNNFVHILLNNEAHESVGGMPTVANGVDFLSVAEACGYQRVIRVDNLVDLDEALADIVDNRVLTFLEIKCAIGSRDDLGRPTTTALENKENFMSFMKE